MGVVGGVIVVLLLFCGVFAGVLAPYGMNEIIPVDRLAPPSADHLLGADQLGRDILSRLIYGARISTIVGLAATTVAVAVAATIGVPSGYLGGTFDLIVQRFVDGWLSVPEFLILLTVVSVVGRGMIELILVMGVLGGIGWSRVVRSAVIGIKENDYFLAAVAIGSTTARTVGRHIFANIMAPIMRRSLFRAVPASSGGRPWGTWPGQVGIGLIELNRAPMEIGMPLWGWRRSAGRVRAGWRARKRTGMRAMAPCDEAGWSSWRADRGR